MEYRIEQNEWDPETFERMLSMIQKASRVNIVVQLEESARLESQTLEKQAGELLNRLGIPCHLLGYGYLKIGIVRGIRYPRELESVTKLLYPQIAKAYDTTAGRVEHSIRHAIKKAWETQQSEVWDDIFGARQRRQNQRPTNAQFIATISDYMTMFN